MKVRAHKPLGPQDVTCVIPTRGDVDMRPVIASFPRNMPWIIWSNKACKDLGVFGRYAAISNATTDVIVTQDDDALLTPESWRQLLEAYEPGKAVCNVPRKFRQRYTDSGLVGFGAIFDRNLPGEAFARYSEFGGDVASEEFRRTCDIVFTMLTPLEFVDLRYADREFASDDNRMWRQPGHWEEREGMREFCRQIRRGVAA